jgi:hypothetical protein
MAAARQAGVWTILIRGVHEDGQEGTRRTPILVLRIVNSSSETLPLEVSVAGSAQDVRSHVEIVLGPRQVKELGADDGLEIQSGDVITLKSPSFRDLVRTA